MKKNNQSWKRIIALVLVICMSMTFTQNINAAQVQDTIESTQSIPGGDLAGTEAESVTQTEAAKLLMLDIKDIHGNSLMEFDNAATEYELLVPGDIDRVIIEAEAADESVVIDETQVGEKTLEIGENEFIISLNDMETEYKITITRQAAEKETDTTSDAVEDTKQIPDVVIPQAEESDTDAPIGPSAASLDALGIVLTAVTNDKQTQATVTVSGLDDNVQSVVVPVWGDAGYQNDLKWYTADKIGSGIWKATIDISSHTETGRYTVHVYTKVNDTSKFIGATGFDITPITASSVQIVEVNEEAETFTVKISGINTPASLTKVSVPVWSSKNGQDDIIWYTAQKSGDSWYATVDLVKHNYDTGNYIVHVYAHDNRGISNIIGSTTVEMKDATKEKLVISLNSDQTKATVTLRNATYNSSTSISFPVWGNKDGQNDVKWYPATQISQGTWQAVVNISDHKESGLYNVHAYTIFNNKQLSMVAHSNFNIAPITASSVQIVDVDEDLETFTVRISGINTTTSLTQVLVPVWSNKEGQDDIIWYPAQKSGDNWYVTVDIMKHNYDLGTYNVHVYAYDNRGISDFVGATTAAITKSAKEKLVVSLNPDETKATITLRNAKYSSSTSIVIPVWGTQNGQNDIKWYPATQVSPGTWQAIVNISDHKESGLYYVHVYTYSNNKTQSIVAWDSFDITSIHTGSITVQEQNNERGTFKIKIDGITSPASITEVLVPVWSDKNGQDDIVWYKAQKSGDSWYVSVDSMNHKLDLGKYIIHVYVKDGRGVQEFVGNTSATVVAEGNPILVIVPNSTQTTVTAILRNVASSNNLKNMYFAVWGSKDGQNDIVWYNASQVAAGIWKVDIDISKHKESGTYNIHIYKAFNDGSKSIITSGVFGITAAKCTSIQIVEKNETTGTYKVKISGITSPAGITKVQVPTWSTVNGQDDIIWYTATKSGNDWYASIAAENHNYATGTYLSHVYITDARGIQEIVGNTSTSLNAVRRQGFVTESGKTYYYSSSYQKVTGWQRINGQRYYFDNNTAVMVTGWSNIEGYRYYFASNGALVQDVRSIIGTQSSYQIKINRQSNCITVYARDTNGTYIIPVVSFITSTGLNNKTPLGTFSTRRLGTWWTLFGPCYGQYVTQITGDILFHSVPYNINGNKYSLKPDYYRQLGKQASAGCVRITTADAKWIYEKIPNGTSVVIYDSGIVGPFDKPTAQEPAYRSGYGWYDPTDPGL